MTMRKTGMTSLNFAASLFSFGFMFLFGIVFTPFLVKHLGVAAYGLIPLCFSLLTYVAFLTQSFSSAIYRELVAAADADDKFNRIFSNAFFLNLSFGFIALTTSLIGSVFITSLIQVPLGFERGAQLIFIALALASTLSIIGIPLEAVIFSTNALYLLSLTQIAQNAVRISVVTALFLWLFADLRFVAVGVLCGALTGFLITFVSAFRLRPTLRLRISDIRKSAVAGLARVGGYVMTNQIGNILLASTDVLMINLALGPEVSGRYAVAAQWGLVLRGLGLSVASVFTARVMQIFYTGSKEETADYVQSSMLFIAAFVALPAGFISGASSQLLSIWLGPEFADEWMVLIALTLPPATSLFFTPLTTVLTASNRVLELGLVTMLAGVLNIIAAGLILKFSTLAGVGVALCMTLSLLLRNVLYVIPRIIAMTAISMASIYRSVALAFIWTLSAAVMSYTLAGYMHPHSFLDLILCGILTAAAYIPLLLVTLPIKLKQLLLNEIRRIGQSFGLLRM